MRNLDDKSFITRTVHAGERIPLDDIHPVVSPLFPSVGYTFADSADLNAVRAEVETAIRSNPALVYAGFEPLYRAALQKRQAQQLKKTAAETAAARAEKVKGVPPKAPESRPVLSEKKVMPRELSYDERLRWIHDNIK